MSKSQSPEPGFLLGSDKKNKAPKTNLTPALHQYFEAKAQSPDSVLFFQMGDFYELFFEDATMAAPLLDLTLTSRQKLNDQPVPLCGMPLSAADNYINRLVSLGHKVAVCDQIGKVLPGSGLAKRQITRIVTPSTVLSAEGQNQARFLAALLHRDDEFILTAVDLSTGDFIAGRFFDYSSFQTAVRAIDPAEIVINAEVFETGPDLVALADSLGVLTTKLAAENFDPERGRTELSAALGPEAGPETFSGWPNLLAAGGATLSYLRDLAGGAGLKHLSRPRLLWEQGFMILDEAATRNLELFKPARDGDHKATLIAQIDLTKTPMGARLIRDWLARPLIDRRTIEERLGAVETLTDELLTRQDLKEALSLGGDLERALSRLTLGRGTIRDLLTIRRTLKAAPKIKELLSQSKSS
ncbi:MAG: hypothetical protein LBS44_05080, partial [Deltaproteobacteria bacterium]|nr:hypothetical protein [Deltaproteobacteria bacterium]